MTVAGVRAKAWELVKVVVGETVGGFLARAIAGLVLAALVGLGVCGRNAGPQFSYDLGQPVSDAVLRLDGPGPHYVWVAKVGFTNDGKRKARPAPTVYLEARDGTQYPADAVEWPEVFGHDDGVVQLTFAVRAGVRPRQLVVVDEQGRRSEEPVVSDLRAEHLPTQSK